jgi:hypothetical protein
MDAIASTPCTLRLAAVSIIARVPMAHAQPGAACPRPAPDRLARRRRRRRGAFAVSLGVGGPLLGRLVDRRGQTTVLMAGALVAGAALVATPRCRPGRRSRAGRRWRACSG